MTVKSVKITGKYGYISEKHDLRADESSYRRKKYMAETDIRRFVNIVDNEAFCSTYGIEPSFQNIHDILKPFERVIDKWDTYIQVECVDGHYILFGVDTPEYSLIGKIMDDKMNVCLSDGTIVPLDKCADTAYDEISKLHGTYINKTAVKCILNKNIKFSDKKINVIIGPNGSGKTSILKAIAEHCHCTTGTGVYDGWSRVDNPYQLNWSYNKKETMNISYKKSNSANVNWDGSPVYYHNFKSVIDHSQQFGDISANSSLFGSNGNSTGDVFMFFNNYKSSGQGNMSLFNVMLEQFVDRRDWSNDIAKIETCNEDHSFDKILETLREWNKSTSKNTVLLDEPEQSFDILTTTIFFKEFLPTLNNDVQIIIVTHSPLVLMNDICDPAIYNVISLDDEFTARCQEIINRK